MRDVWDILESRVISGIWFEDEVAKRIERNECVPGGYCDGGARKGVARYRFFQN
jgi:hypothetical protein